MFLGPPQRHRTVALALLLILLLALAASASHVQWLSWSPEGQRWFFLAILAPYWAVLINARSHAAPELVMSATQHPSHHTIASPTHPPIGFSIMRPAALENTAPPRPQAFWDEMPHPVMAVTVSGQLLSANPAAHALLSVFREGSVRPHSPSDVLQHHTPEPSAAQEDPATPSLWHYWPLPPSIHVSLSSLADPVQERHTVTWEVGDDVRGWWQLSATRPGPELLRNSPVTWSPSDVLLISATDMTQVHHLNARLAHQMVHDTTTGLPNRRAFAFWVNHILVRLRTQSGSGAVLYLDLDQFKVFNDAAGHAAGDRLLTEIADVLLSASRPGEHVARLGGDEFGIVLDEADASHAMEASGRYLQALQEFSWTVDGLMWKSVGSMGVALIDDHRLTHQEIMTRGDTACYLAKEQGGNRAMLYHPVAPEIVAHRNAMRWMAQLQRALRENELEMWVQEVRRFAPRPPEAAAQVEALVRWRGSDGELIQPSDFIPAAERFGMMPSVDRWIVNRTLALLHATPGNKIARCAINISGPSLSDPTFADFLLTTIDTSGVAPHRMGIEITETAALLSATRAIDLLSRLRERGVHVAIDDFGAGMASFEYLKILPADSVKIDGSFIRARQAHPVNGAVIRAVVEIGRLCGLEVVAESVTSQDDLDYLQEVGVDKVQGFFLHKPEPWLSFVNS